MKFLLKKGLFLLAFLLCLTSCGYHFGLGEIPNQYRTISVPYAEGDTDGSLTAEVIKRVSTSGAFQFQRSGGDLTLKITILDYDDENIGFRYYRNKEGELKRETIPDETRLTVTAEIALIDATTGEALLGPVMMSAYTDFDHDYYSTRHQINVFSLGQLTDYDEAYDAAERPLNYILAQKIVDYICDSW